ncbi:pentapeptide repeat-containing protein [Pararhodobacter aggregans]|uniref:Pentapeptide repeat-containing protein n=1 Tax=Pararhodobacter aggregans TaxID=404875 RepID=A0A2T7UR56_9RHOB|nr:pentapeptide repeat-containing protein [Pararhodobacter aggregans]PTX01933.1 pentapeptide repeat protein [Pararhodobacter aggregans]PVE47119.1 hypothetical protein DDE23_12790 [Pararhodobacter aggregans]
MSDQPEKIPPQDLLDWLGLNGAPNWALARPLGKLFGALLVLIFFAAVAAAVSVLFGTIRDVFWSDDGAGPNLGAGALVTAILGAPFLIWGTIIRHQSLRYQKEGHMTDRIAKAVEQLGAEKKVDRIGRPVELHRGHPDQLSAGEQLETRTAIEWRDVGLEKQENEWVGASGEWQVFSETVPNLEVRIGAILSLERIAQDSTTHDKGRDHVRVMEILCAYIRNNAPASDLTPRTPPFDIKWSRIDIQTVIDVLRRRSPAQTKLEEIERFRLNLRGADLSGIDFSKGIFSDADMSLCRIEGSDFSDCDLRGAKMIHSMLHRPIFFRTDLAGLHLNYANVSELGPVGFLVSKRFFVFIAGARVQSMIFTSKFSECYFGSSDTIVGSSYARSARLGPAISRARIEYEGQNDKLEGCILALCRGHSAAEVEGAKMFEHWLPHHSKDLISSPFRSDFLEKHGLRGWPYDDS